MFSVFTGSKQTGILLGLNLLANFPPNSVCVSLKYLLKMITAPSTNSSTTSSTAFVSPSALRPTKSLQATSSTISRSRSRSRPPPAAKRPRAISQATHSGVEGKGVSIDHAFENKRVVGLGLLCMDILATVRKFPEADTKIRTTNMSLKGGGNCSNTCTAIRRLGVPVTLLSQVGDDVYGHQCMSELEDDGVDTSFIKLGHKQHNVPTAFTYVIIDSSTNTRTCISTVPNEDIPVDDIFKLQTSQCLDGGCGDGDDDRGDDDDRVVLIVLDGRHTLASIYLAEEGRKRGIPILLDVERERPHIRRLLPLVDYIITNRQFALSFGDGTDLIQGMEALLAFGDAHFVLSTSGEKGCTLLTKDLGINTPNHYEIGQVTIDTYVSHLNNGNHYRIWTCSAWMVDKNNVVDTTGAGDAFIAGIAYSLINGLPNHQMLSLASFIACCNICGAGSRTTLPTLENIPSYLRSYSTK